MSLLETLRNELTGEVVGHISRALGEDSQIVHKASIAALPTVIASILNQAQSAQGADKLIRTIKDFQGAHSPIGSLSELINTGAISNITKMVPQEMILGLLGSKTNLIIDMLGKITGSSSGLIQKVISTIIPVVLGTLSKNILSKANPASALIAMIPGELKAAQAALPAGLGSLIGLGSLASSMTSTVSKHGAHGAPHSPGDAATSSSWLSYAAIPLLLIAGYALYTKYQGAASDLNRQVTQVQHSVTESQSNVQKSVETAVDKAIVSVEQAQQTAEDMRAGLKVEAADIANQVSKAADKAIQAAESITQNGKTAIKLPNGAALEVKENSFTAKLVSQIGKAADNSPVSFDQVAFSTASAGLTPESSAQLNEFVSVLKAYPTIKIAINGYTDSTGIPENNLALSQLRAEAVKTYLAKAGISGDRVQTAGRGDQNPIADNATPEGRARNRRIEVTIVK